MSRAWRARLRTSVLVCGGILAMIASETYAQFPIFHGGEALTPFGQRGSDGSYLSPSAKRLNTRGLKTAKARSKAAVAVQPTTPRKNGLFGKGFRFWRSQ